MALKYVEDLRSENRMRTIIEGKSDQRKIDLDSIDYVGSEPLDHTENGQRLQPEYKHPNRDDSTGYKEKHHFLSFCMASADFPCANSACFGVLLFSLRLKAPPEFR
jgi:hypothetical protein